MRRFAITALAALLAATPVFAPALAEAGGATSVPEPTDALLLLLGAAGVAIGRRMHARRDRRDKKD